MLYSGRTEIEYSPDSRENLVMRAQVQDRSSGPNRHNYTLEIAVSHPRSNIDVNMVSHVANNKHIMSTNMEINYQNAAKKTNNIILRGEIQKLRQRLSMQVCILS